MSEVRVKQEGAEHNRVTQIGRVRFIEKDESDYKGLLEVHTENYDRCILSIGCNDDVFHVNGTNFHEYDGPINVVCHDIEDALRMLTSLMFVHLDL